IDVFVRGGDSNPQTDAANTMALYHVYWNGSSWNWQYLGGVISSHPSAVSWGVNRVDVFAVGTDGHMYHVGGDGVNFSWEAIPATAAPSSFLGPMKAISTSSGTLDLYAVGTDNLLYHNNYRTIYPPPPA